VRLLSSFHKSIYLHLKDLIWISVLLWQITRLAHATPSLDGRNMRIGSKDQTLIIWYSDLLACPQHQYKLPKWWKNAADTGKGGSHWELDWLLDSCSKWAEWFNYFSFAMLSKRSLHSAAQSTDPTERTVIRWRFSFMYSVCATLIRNTNGAHCALRRAASYSFPSPTCALHPQK
jgi:hypothetical protein